MRLRLDLNRIGLWLLGLMCLLPFLSAHHQLPIPSFYGELAAAVLGLAATSALLAPSAWQPFQLPRIALLPLGLVALILLQFLTGGIVHPQQAQLGMLYLLWAMLLMVLAHHLRQQLGWERFVLVLSWSLLAGGVFSAMVVVSQLAGWQSPLLVPRRVAQVYGNLGQANHFADYVALALGSLLYLDLKQRLPAALTVLLATMFLIMLALSGSRSSWLYLLAFSMSSMWLSRREGRRHLMLLSMLLLPVFLLVQQVVPWMTSLAGSAAMQTPNERLFQEVAGTGVRLQLWQQAWQMFIGSPWLGVGFGQFDWNSFVLIERMPALTVEPAEHAHNLLLHLLAEMGVLGGLLVLLLGGLWLAGCLRGESTPERWWVLALLMVLGIHSLLEYPLWYTYFLGIAAMLLGAGDARPLSLELQRIGRWALAAMLLLGSMGLISLTQSYAQLEHWMQRGLRGQVQDAQLPDITRDLMQVHQESLLSSYVELVLAASLAPSVEQLDDKLLLNQAAMRFSPIRMVVYRHVLLLALKGDRVAALVQLRRAMRAYPRDVPGFAKGLRLLVAKSPGHYEFLLNEVAEQAKE